MNPSTSLYWRIAPDFPIVSRRWDDECLVFHAGSGNTHLLNAVAGAVLTSLDTGPATPEQLVERVAEQLGYQVDAEFTAYVRQTSAELNGLELIEAVPADA